MPEAQCVQQRGRRMAWRLGQAVYEERQRELGVSNLQNKMHMVKGQEATTASCSKEHCSWLQGQNSLS